MSRWWGCVLLAWLPLCAYPALAADSNPALDAQQAEFFEKRIRPLLVERCHECHAAETHEAGLRLDSRGAILRGGDSGPAAVPGEPNASLLVRAVGYLDPALQMPPDGKLPREDIARLEQWVALGLPWPGQAGDDPPAADRPAGYGADVLGHWAFQPVPRVTIPQPRDTAWPASPIDRFILARLEQAGLQPAPPADKRTLLRRVTFDLTGLPPTPEEVAAFLADETPSAFQRVVDRLLASPAYGQRWARHWLDLVRFAETNGFNRDPDKPNMYRYRDYVIEALNQDLPYDRFIVENLAGDLVQPRLTADGRHQASIIATGMLWSSELVYNPLDPAEQRSDQVDAQLDVLGKALLGLTLGCARCHDHKFDPIPTRDYYALAGILHSTKGVQRPVAAAVAQTAAADYQPSVTPLEVQNWLFDAVDAPRLDEVRRAAGYMTASAPLLRLPRDKALARAGAAAQSAALRPDVLREWIMFFNRSDAPDNPNVGPWLRIVRHSGDDLREAIAEVINGWPYKPGVKPINPLTLAALSDPAVGSLASLAGRYQQIMLDVITAKKYHDPVHKQWLNWFHRPDTPFRAAMFESRLTAPQSARLADMRRRVAAGKPAPVPMAMASAEADDPRFEVYQVRLASFPDAWSLPREMAVGDIHVHLRGVYNRFGPKVPRGVLSALPGHDSFHVSQGSGRLELARWIASPDNPLTARVMVNRLWQHHFGRGLVETPSNFGLTGSRPSHPELLDWLARQFVDRGWSLKAMHRLMLLSSTYQMSSYPSDRAAQLDPDNRLLGHMPLRRLEAEAVRDAVLAVSGSLSPLQTDGPGVNPFITPFMYPRFHPQPGPLDGDGRRSVYITVRRNFLTPLLTAFDFPLPAESVDRRDINILPTQALVMLNSEFVHQQAARWGQRVAAADGAVGQRVAGMFERALARLPHDAELEEMTRFVTRRASQLQCGLDDPRPWTDLAHALFNTHAFVFIR